MKFTRRQTFAMVACMGAALSTGSAMAQAYPSKPNKRN